MEKQIEKISFQKPPRPEALERAPATPPPAAPWRPRPRGPRGVRGASFANELQLVFRKLPAPFNDFSDFSGPLPLFCVFSDAVVAKSGLRQPKMSLGKMLKAITAMPPVRTSASRSSHRSRSWSTTVARIASVDSRRAHCARACDPPTPLVRTP